MAKKPTPLVQISKADLAKMSRSEQRRYVDLGYVSGETKAKAE